MTGLFIDLLNWINGNIVHNYGWSIVIFTLLIRLVLLPLDIKSKKSMRAISKIQPKLNALQKKYANDKDKLNQKTMELYRKEHVSPTAGCLPMLISLPILWIMFSAMRTVGNANTIQMLLDMQSSGELPNFVKEGYSWLWIKNVFQPDSFMATILPTIPNLLSAIRPSSAIAVLTQENIDQVMAYIQSKDYLLLAGNLAPSYAFSYAKFLGMNLFVPTSLSYVFQYGNGLFILPLLAGASQFLMTKIMNGKQTPEQKALAEAQKADQSQTNPMNSPVMKWFFPIFSVWICATSNAAFSIYWMAANVIQIVQQLAVNWYFERQDKKAAAENPTQEQQ